MGKLERGKNYIFQRKKGRAKYLWNVIDYVSLQRGKWHFCPRRWHANPCLIFSHSQASGCSCSHSSTALINMRRGEVLRCDIHPKCLLSFFFSIKVRNKMIDIKYIHIHMCHLCVYPRVKSNRNINSAWMAFGLCSNTMQSEYIDIIFNQSMRCSRAWKQEE